MGCEGHRAGKVGGSERRRRTLAGNGVGQLQQIGRRGRNSRERRRSKAASSRRQYKSRIGAGRWRPKRWPAAPSGPQNHPDRQEGIAIVVAEVILHGLRLASRLRGTLQPCQQSIPRQTLAVAPSMSARYPGRPGRARPARPLDLLLRVLHRWRECNTGESTDDAALFLEGSTVQSPPKSLACTQPQTKSPKLSPVPKCFRFGLDWVREALAAENRLADRPGSAMGFSATDPEPVQLLKNPSNSSLTWFFIVVHIPWGAPFQIFRVAPLTIVDDNRAEQAIGTIWSSSP